MTEMEYQGVLNCLEELEKLPRLTAAERIALDVVIEIVLDKLYPAQSEPIPGVAA